MNDRQLAGKRIAILAADGVEELEYRKLKEAVEAAGATTELLSLLPGVIWAMNHDLEPVVRIPVDKAVADASPADYDGLIIPGGTVNPDHLRQDPRAVTFIQDYFSSGKPAGVICRGLWVLAEAGAIVVDAEAMVDQGPVAASGPDDLPAFCANVVEEFAQSRQHVAASVADG